MKKLLTLLLFPALLLAEGFPGNFPTNTNIIQVGRQAGEAELVIGAGSGNTGYIRNANNDGIIELTGGSTSGNGPDILLYGGSHATKALDMEFKDNTNTFLAHDASADTVTLGYAAAGLQINNASLGFFSTSAIAQPSTFTLTNFVDEDISYDTDSTTTAELSKVLATVISYLAEYGLFQTS